MPVISIFYGILIKMYFGDYVPPHFHEEYGEFVAQISINNFAVIDGYLPPKALALVMEWASINKDELIDNWKSLSEGGTGTFNKIEPLNDYMKLTPYLHFAGNAEEALNFYRDALGGDIVMINRYGDSPIPSDEDYKEKIMHSRLVFGDNMIMISDTFKGNAVSTNGNIQLSIEADSGDQINTVFEKMGEGGKVTMPLQKQFWGATFGMLEDKFGVAWMFNCEDKK